QNPGWMDPAGRETIMSIKLSEESEKAVNKYAKSRDLSPNEAADKLISIAAGRVKALSTYNEKNKESKPAKPKKAKAAAAKKPAKAAAKPAGKGGPGRPPGSKNKPKAEAAPAKPKISHKPNVKLVPANGSRKPAIEIPDEETHEEELQEEAVAEEEEE